MIVTARSIQDLVDIFCQDYTSGVTSNFAPRTGPQDHKNGLPIPHLALYGLKIGPF